MSVELKTMAALPAAIEPGKCEACAVKHSADDPHNQQSLHWKYWFYERNNRWPTWEDAIAHCTPEKQEMWRVELRKYGIKI